jgi:chromosome segregation ATPase
MEDLMGVAGIATRLERFAAVLVGLEREVTQLHAASKRLELAEKMQPPPPPRNGAEVEALRTELEWAKAEVKRLADEKERSEGELQSLRVYREETRSQIKKAVASIVDVKLDSKAEQVVKAIVVDRDRLQEEKAKIESDMARIKAEATKRFTSLKNDLEKTQKDLEVQRTQRENLLRQLQDRDAMQGSGEVTLEDITSSEIFRTMLANIKKTSRQELTILHDAIGSIRTIDPRAYEVVMEVAKKAFLKNQMENPLATLPRV